MLIIVFHLTVNNRCNASYLFCITKIAVNDDYDDDSDDDSYNDDDDDDDILIYLNYRYFKASYACVCVCVCLCVFRKHKVPLLGVLNNLLKILILF